jgi:hypothetical protein
MRFRAASFAALFAIACGLLAARSEYFAPTHRLSGLGVDRQDMTAAVLEARTDRMIQSHTFGILRDSRALEGAARITSPALQRIFEDASRDSGLPAAALAAIAYLESFGDPKAESPAGPKGIMQFSEATARAAGLQIVRTVRYRVSTEKKLVSAKKGKPKYKTVKTKTPYTVLVRDDRFTPERAIPAAAHYLARVAAKFGGLDWAIFAYHCGEGCAAEVHGLAEEALGRKNGLSVAATFFAASPAHHRQLYEALHYHMQRDFSPTYWFRIQRAQQLLDLYRSNPESFRNLMAEYKDSVNPDWRASHRLVIWLKPEDVLYKSCEDLKREQGKSLVRPPDDPSYYGFNVLRPKPALFTAPGNEDLYLQATPAALGTLMYIAFETRRLYEAMKQRREPFTPLEVTELVGTLDTSSGRTHLLKAPGADRDSAFPAHCTGQVFDLSERALPAGEREALEFVLDEMGWDGYLGFVQASGGTMHVGCSPSAREFFAGVWGERDEKDR